MRCTSAGKADDLSNIEFAKNINKDKYHRSQKIALINSRTLLERLMSFRESDYTKP
ncbi:uncharacterized protein RHIMIDRAFT_257705 [Rhizopus microsporus ATCC 52813]|uniref:Uncharacterized protein n=1 Tax=Rhizopus microsporus ATCC 52813 TaxID=1340429 RepID=A0A2G4SRT1_RHIZD|nr:uncharacterized protein RHIMIDRAFT_257705 [Rhizopus microsporus ATCC 52813]PHZ11470.1 hypothetical protein RHIMIDRAFT_257705 [Rhizopus microsporus ATCC 52813]